MEKKSEPEIGLDRMGEPIIDPAPDRPPDMEDSPASNALAKGAKWGAVAGVLIAQWYMREHSPLGFYMGNVLLVFAVCIGICGWVGAAIAWLNYKRSTPA